MHDISLIRELTIILIVSLVIVFVFRKIKLPSLIGYLFAGILIGPHGAKLISSLEAINIMAETGVILLLFVIGVELSIKKLLQMKKYVFAIGGAQFFLTALIVASIFSVAGFPISNGIFFGIIISLSSTAIVLKLLVERNELDSLHGRLSFGVLLFQDIAVAPILLLLPLLISGGEFTPAQTFLKTLKAFGFLTAIIIAARYIIPKFVYQLAKLKSRESFTIGALFIVFGAAYLAELVGLSLAIGAFIAGIILSESDFSHQINADIIPFKDAFISLFFVSIGLMLDLSFVYHNPVLTAVIALSVLFLKSTIIIIILKVFGFSNRIAILTALIISQVGEFSFIIAQTGAGYNIITSEYFNLFLASSIFTMALTPLLFKLAPLIGYKANDLKFQRKENHVVIIGFGLNGRNLARVLKEIGIQYCAVDLNPDIFKKCKSKGEPVIFGDATKREVLTLAGVEKAKIIVIAISDPGASQIALALAKEMNPSIYSIVRTRFQGEIYNLQKIGADDIIPEEFETSIQIFTKTLQKYHIPLNIIMRQANIIRRESYSMLRSEIETESALTHLDKILAEGLIETFYVEDENPNLNKSVKELNVRAETGATIITIMRNGTTINNPSGSEIIRAGDSLVIYGNHNSVDKAIELLISRR